MLRDNHCSQISIIPETWNNPKYICVLHSDHDSVLRVGVWLLIQSKSSSGYSSGAPDSARCVPCTWRLAKEGAPPISSERWEAKKKRQEEEMTQLGAVRAITPVLPNLQSDCRNVPYSWRTTVEAWRGIQMRKHLYTELIERVKVQSI